MQRTIVTALICSSFLVAGSVYAQAPPSCESRLQVLSEYAGVVAQGRTNVEAEVAGLKVQLNALRAELDALKTPKPSVVKEEKK